MDQHRDEAKTSSNLPVGSSRIKPLPQDVVSQIKSSVVVTSLIDVILGLVKNSLDARATKIEIAVNHARGGCTVEDDGVGIHPADFAESGGLIKLHQTSKAEEEYVHGRTGAFLASLSAMSLLTIVSRHQQYRQCNSLTFHQGRLVSRLIPCPEHQEIQARHGTRVLVRDLFGNFPVRVKQRAVAPDSEMDRLWNELKLALIALLLAWEPRISLKLLNEGNGQMILNIRQSSNCQQVESSVKSSSKLPWLLTQGGFLSPSTKHNWIPASASSTHVRIKGVIAIEPAPTRHLQFLSIGLQPVNKSTGADLYDFINRRFKHSQFGVLDEDSDIGREIMSNRYDLRPKDLKPVKRGVERWPMYDLSIFFPNVAMAEKAAVGEHRALEKVMNVLDALVTNWLSAHYFTTTHKVKMDDKGVSPSESQKATSAKVSPHTLKHRSHLFSSPAISKSRISTSLGPEMQLNSSGQTSADSGMRSIAEMNDLDSNSQKDSPVLTLKHPMNQETESSVSKRVKPSSRRLTLRPESTPNIEKSVPWIDSLLAKWENPVFQITEPRIQKSYEDFKRHSCCAETEALMPDKLNDFSIASGSKLTKAALENARIIGNVDNQFVLIKVTDDKGLEVLVAVDQHAADERCKVEQLFSDFCQPQNEKAQVKSKLGLISSLDCTQLEKPLNFELGQKELDHFRARAKVFANWGILYDIENPKTNNQMGKIIVQGLPPTIATRATSDPQVLITMLRTEIWKMVDQRLPTVDHLEKNDDSKHPWLRKMGRCPNGIVDLLNSRACRSAIMFNDALTEAECKGLIQSLANCAFPFQCAHGRPSMVPLIHFGKIGVSFGHDAEEKPFIDAFDAWKKRHQDII